MGKFCDAHRKFCDSIRACRKFYVLICKIYAEHGFIFEFYAGHESVLVAKFGGLRRGLCDARSKFRDSVDACCKFYVLSHAFCKEHRLFYEFHMEHH